MDTTALQKQVFDLLTESVKDLWEQEDKEFLKNLAMDIATEKVLMSTDPDRSEVHAQNLMHLAATVNGEIAIRQLKIKKEAKEVVIKILITVIKT